MTYNSIITMPEVYITVNKSRKKIYNSKTIYLENGNQFEFELFNPTQQVLMAKIKIDGNYISSRGLILNPGVRVFLERHIDSPKRFLFSTYMVDKNNPAVQKAIENNGLIEVEFYPEKTQPIITYTDNRSPYGVYYDKNYNSFTTLDTFVGGIYLSNTSYLNDTLGFSESNLNTKSKLTKSKSLSETGRVEKGDQSNQTFSEVNKEFECYYITKVEYKILPLSEKMVQPNELIKYCTSCGRKAKKQDRFCASCGSRV